MASDITSSAQFATANMKPDPGEQGDALWAQKVADNSGYLWFMHKPGPTIDAYSQRLHANSFSAGDGTFQGTKFFRKETNYGTLYGSYVGNFSGAGQGLEIFVNGASLINRNTSGAGALTGSLSVSVSGLSDGNIYEFVGLMKHGSTTNNFASLSVTSWFKP